MTNSDIAEIIADAISNVTDKEVIDFLIEFIQNYLTLTSMEQRMLSNQSMHKEMKPYILNLLTSMNQPKFYDLYYELIMHSSEAIQKIGLIIEKNTAFKQRKRTQG